VAESEEVDDEEEEDVADDDEDDGDDPAVSIDGVSRSAWRRTNHLIGKTPSSLTLPLAKLLPSASDCGSDSDSRSDSNSDSGSALSAHSPQR